MKEMSLMNSNIVSNMKDNKKDKKNYGKNMSCIKVMKPSITKGVNRVGIMQDQPC